MGWRVPLGAGVLVDHEHVAVPAGVTKRRSGHDGERRHPDRPETGPVGGDGEREIDDGRGVGLSGPLIEFAVDLELVRHGGGDELPLLRGDRRCGGLG